MKLYSVYGLARLALGLRESRVGKGPMAGGKEEKIRVARSLICERVLSRNLSNKLPMWNFTVRSVIPRTRAMATVPSFVMSSCRTFHSMGVRNVGI